VGRENPDLTPLLPNVDRDQRSSAADAHTGARRRSPPPTLFIRGNPLGPGQRGQSKCRHPQNCRPRPRAGACLADSGQARRSPHLCASIWISSNGFRSSLGWGGSLERGTRQPVACRIAPFRSAGAGQRDLCGLQLWVKGKVVEQSPGPRHTRSVFSGGAKRISTIFCVTRTSQRK
jgi:hypothetical protein